MKTTGTSAATIKRKDWEALFAEAKAEIAEAKAEISRLREHNARHCARCGREEHERRAREAASKVEASLADERKEQARLDALRKEYNNGEPERQGNERNYQKYLDRVEAMKADIAASEANVGSLKRELSAIR